MARAVAVAAADVAAAEAAVEAAVATEEGVAFDRFEIVRKIQQGHVLASSEIAHLKVLSQEQKDQKVRREEANSHKHAHCVSGSACLF